MPQQAGSSLGLYEPTALIGAGGMGEVWRAQDTRRARSRQEDRVKLVLNWPRGLARLAAAGRDER